MLYLAATAGTAGVANAKPAAKHAAHAPAAAKKAPEAAAAPDAAPADGKPAEAEAPQDPLANIPHINGPKLVDLGHSAQVNLPAGMALLEQATAQAELRKLGNDVDGLIAVIVSTKPGEDWMIAIEAADVGYVTDDDADELDAGELLNSYKQGTTEQNKKREEMKIAPLFIDDWSEKPRYDKTVHHLVWGIQAHSVENGTTSKSINYFTRILGRNGFLSVNVVGAAETMEASKAQAAPVIQAITFKPGATYRDHADGDKDSGVGLKGLVLAGVGLAVAKKTGILLGLFLVLKKGVIVVFVAIAAFFKKMFGRLFGRKKEEPVVAQQGDVPPGQGFAPPPDQGGYNPGGGYPPGGGYGGYNPPGGGGGYGPNGGGGFDPNGGGHGANGGGHAGGGFDPNGGGGFGGGGGGFGPQGGGGGAPPAA